MVPDDCTLGILSNAHKFPLDLDGNAQIQVGFNLAHGTEILHQSTWGIFEEMVVLTTSKAGQFTLGWNNYQSITKSASTLWPSALVRTVMPWI